ncbi:hypothetical protein [Sphingorhabdus pulchriflava]|uniref:hypothetical protein n=1 Tax=Sphingorhabdus pulchriflava TaxID=2292257 RepID=UPI0011C034A2|nr:hypothetical protein [Sphingorhabdus pulchriflava]
MSISSSFKCVGYISITTSKNGVLYPIFHHGSINWPFVQEIDINGKITSFIEFFDTDKFVFIPSLRSWFCREGDYSRYAYYDSAGTLCETSYEEIGPAIRTGELALNDERLPLLTRLTLARLGNAQESLLAELHESYLRNCGLPDRSVTKLTRSDTRARRSNDIWWEQIRAAEFGEGFVAESFKDTPTEEIFEWLFEYPVDEEWKRVFLVLARRVMFDDRIFDLLTKFLGESHNFTDFSHIDKLIVGRLIELYSYSDSDNNDIADILYDELMNGSIFYLCGTVEPRVILKYLDKITKKKDEEGDLMQIIDSVIDYLSSDTSNVLIFMDLFWFIVDSNQLLVEYPSFSYYEGATRLDRLIAEYQFNPRFQLNLSKDGKLFFDEMILDE